MPTRAKYSTIAKHFTSKKDENLLYGRLYDQPVVSIQDALHAVDSATIRGEVFLVETREIKSKNTGKEWVKIGFDITDLHGSMRVSKFLAKEKADEYVDLIHEGMYLTVQGKVSFDNFEKETIMEPTGIVLSKKKMRMDTAEKKRVELHLHIQYVRNGRHVHDKIPHAARKNVGTYGDGNHRSRRGTGLSGSHACD